VPAIAFVGRQVATMKRELAALVLRRTGLGLLLGRVLRWAGVLCVNYHRIGTGAGSLFDRELWSASDAAFNSQVSYLKAHFDVISPSDLPNVQSRQKGRYVLITFDDGYVDNYQVAFPILSRLQVPATFFISTGFIDSPRLAWWDEIAWMTRTCKQAAVDLPRWFSVPIQLDEPERQVAVRTLLRKYKTIPAPGTEDYLYALAEATGSGRYSAASGKPVWMTWDMIRKMRTAGMTIGGHTVNHPVLSQMPRDGQMEEIGGCGKRIADELGEPMKYFSYPVGGPKAFNDDTRSCLRDAGVEFAFSYYGGFAKLGAWDNYDMPRIAVEEYITTDWFRSIVNLPGFFGAAQ
jgi:peptidoglycan/xylan/chitin deacetylase (PgdA/CDA1 family)